MPKHFEEKVDVGLVVKTNAEAKHKAVFSSTVLGTIVGILVALLVPSLSDRIRIALAGILLIALLVAVANNRARYFVITSLRQLPERLAATKTYGDDKKPANHDD